MVDGGVHEPVKPKPDRTKEPDGCHLRLMDERVYDAAGQSGWSDRFNTTSA